MITVNLIKNGHISQPKKSQPPNPNNFPNPNAKTVQLPFPSPSFPKSSFPFILGASHANKNKGGLPYQGKLAYSQANHFYPHCLQVGGAASTHPTRRINLYIGLCRLYYQLIQADNHMRITLALLLLLTIAYAQNCNGCKPATQIATCPDYHCYRCDKNEVLNIDTLNCDCIQGYYRINGFCGQCPEGYSYDPITQWCEGINTCGPNQVLVNQVCQCQPGLIVIQNICQRCPVNQTYYPQYDSCRCSPGYSLVDGSCILIECGLNQVYSDKLLKCVCAFGYYLINGTCGTCPNNQVYSSDTQSCNPIIRPTCGFNQYFYECCCFCENGYVKINGVCVRCPEHSSYNWNLNACVCDEGYYFVGEQVKQRPYQSQDTGSSFTSNPGNIYYAYGPSTGPGSSGVITAFSNYDASGVNTNGVNANNPVQVNRNN